jgi:hypothetical protein
VVWTKKIRASGTCVTKPNGGPTPRLPLGEGCGVQRGGFGGLCGRFGVRGIEYRAWLVGRER